MLKTTRIKDFTYKNKKYKFKEPLKIRIEKYLLMDGKTYGWELYIPEIPDGFTRYEEISDIEKEIKKFIKNIFDNYLIIDDNNLNQFDRDYKHKWISLIQLPKTRNKG